MQSKMKIATIFALSAAVISGTNNFLAKIAVSAIKDPILYTTLKNSIVALFLVGVLFALKRLDEIKMLTRRQIIQLLLIGLIGGSIPFALFFTGLTHTSAINAGLIHKTLFVWVIFLALPILKEKVTRPQIAGAALILFANFFVGGFVGFKFNAGEFYILAATIFWAIENIIAKIALKDLSSLLLAASRMVFGSLILGAFVLFNGGFGAVSHLNNTQWTWTFLTSALLTGYVISWYAALKYAPAIYVAILLVPATLVTNVLSAIFITRAFSANDFLSAVFYILGVTLVIISARKAMNQSALAQPALA